MLFIKLQRTPVNGNVANGEVKVASVRGIFFFLDRSATVMYSD
jgi:hypothetical protein